MQAKRLEINNFRGIRSLTIDFHDRMNVFIGENGAGKSAVLDLLAIMLSDFIRRLRPEKGTGRSYSKWDITNGEARTLNRISVDFEMGRTIWNSVKIKPGRLRTIQADFKALNNVIRNYQYEFETQKDLDFPICIHYGVNRALLDIPRRVRTKHSFASQLSAYDNALTSGTSDFRRFFEWFRNRQQQDGQIAVKLLESQDIEDPRREFAKYRDPQLDIVNKAIVSIMKRIRIARVQRSAPQSMIVSKQGEELSIDQLSDGEKCTLAMVGDLARRLVIANPARDDPLKGSGVVMIDEIDLHLHPAWQRMIVPGLRETFPNCQFILTTHSPQVIGHIRSESVYILRRFGLQTEISHPEGSYGLDSNYILEAFMGGSVRNSEAEVALRTIFDEIDKGNLAEAKERIAAFRRDISDVPELAKAEVLIRSKRALAK
ncbi:MAG: AAA family ATPase [Candidatus Coatesbacteria bacterium]|nr:AAA family ATPase [Candidatus Coatesbacteria bacterium]